MPKLSSKPKTGKTSDDPITSLRRKVVDRAMGRVIQEARTKTGISQTSLAANLHIRSDLLSKLETGQRRLTPEHRSLLRGFFDGKLDDPKFEEWLEATSQSEWARVQLMATEEELNARLTELNDLPAPPRKDVIFWNPRVRQGDPSVSGGTTASVGQPSIAAFRDPFESMDLGPVVAGLRATTVAVAIEVIRESCARPPEAAEERLFNLLELFRQLSEIDDLTLQKLARLARSRVDELSSNG